MMDHIVDAIDIKQTHAQTHIHTQTDRHAHTQTHTDRHALVS